MDVSTQAAQAVDNISAEGFAPFFHEGFALVKYVLFKGRTPGQADPVGVAVLRKDGAFYTSVMFERRGGYVYAEPVGVV